MSICLDGVLQMSKTMEKRANTDALILEGLLLSPTVRAAAEYAQVDPKTIYNRLADSAFSERYKTLRDQRLDAIGSALDRLSQLAILELEGILLNPDSKPRDKISAARTVLSARGYKVDQR